MSAARVARGMGAAVVMLDTNISKLRYASEQLGGAIVTELIQDVVLKQGWRKPM